MWIVVYGRAHRHTHKHTCTQIPILMNRIHDALAWIIDWIGHCNRFSMMTHILEPLIGLAVHLCVCNRVCFFHLQFSPIAAPVGKPFIRYCCEHWKRRWKPIAKIMIYRNHCHSHMHIWEILRPYDNYRLQESDTWICFSFVSLERLSVIWNEFQYCQISIDQNLSRPASVETSFLLLFVKRHMLTIYNPY